MSQDSITDVDYIVIGGGTSGLVVASRLSEDPNTYVLVLEAGQDSTADPRVNIPALWTSLLGSEADWKYETLPQQFLGGRSVQAPQGKGLGGSSLLNAQAWIAPSQAGIDIWAKLGNPSWDWAALAPYYKKVHTLNLPPDQATRDHLGIDWIDDKYRGTSGPVQVSFPGVIQNPVGKAWVDAFRGMNKATTGDPFSGNSVGGYSNAATIDPINKVRSYAGSAYGLPAIQRPNFHLVTGATAQKILFDQTSSNVTARGVQATIQGQSRIFNARKEVIVAAGAFNTPKLLELSGVGSKELLAKHNIPLVIDNPGVGENMQDHLGSGVSFEVADGILTGDPLVRQEPEAIQTAQQLYAEHKAGPFTSGGGLSHAFMAVPELDHAEGQKELKRLIDRYPPKPEDAEYFDSVRSIVENPSEASAALLLFQAQANLHNVKSIMGGETVKLLPENFATLGLLQCHPFSRGSTHISSADADAAPDIDPCYFSNPLDLEIMARHLQSLEALRNTPELASIFKPGGKRNHEDSYHIKDLDVAKRYLFDTVNTSYHTCGTAVMLPREKGGVVDENLIVYGTDNLRVVDASIFPLIPRGNIQSTVYAVAERAADIIKR